MMNHMLIQDICVNINVVQFISYANPILVVVEMEDIKTIFFLQG